MIMPTNKPHRALALRHRERLRLDFVVGERRRVSLGHVAYDVAPDWISDRGESPGAVEHV